MFTREVVGRRRTLYIVTLSNHKSVTELLKLDSLLICIIKFPLQADAIEENQDPSTKSLILVRNKSYLEVERFSFECRKVIDFAFTTLRDWLKKLAPLFHPIRSKTKTNGDSLVRVFPHFASATCNYFVF